MDSYFADGYVDIGFPCEVRIDQTGIEICYKAGKDYARYIGKNDGSGHFQLEDASVGARASLHMFPGSRFLEGYWVEEGRRGMWRISLDEGRRDERALSSRRKATTAVEPARDSTARGSQLSKDNRKVVNEKTARKAASGSKDHLKKVSTTKRPPKTAAKTKGTKVRWADIPRMSAVVIGRTQSKSSVGPSHSPRTTDRQVVRSSPTPPDRHKAATKVQRPQGKSAFGILSSRGKRLKRAGRCHHCGKQCTQIWQYKT